MPRDIGTGIYTYPSGTQGNSGQTIFSARYNTFLNDLANTMNQPLPVNMGGTGAVMVANARDNLDVEVSGAQVTNYDLQVWENGSFWSAPGATGAPEAGGYYVGTAIVYGTDQQNIILEARNVKGVTVPPILWVKQKKDGVWQNSNTWIVDFADRYVDVTGDTMTGVLNINASGPSILNVRNLGSGVGVVVQNSVDTDAAIGILNAASTSWNHLFYGNGNSSHQGTLAVNGGTTLYSTLAVTGVTTLSSALAVSGGTTLGTVNVSGIQTITNSTVSINSSTGALVVNGGVGIGGAVNIASGMNVQSVNTGLVTVSGGLTCNGITLNGIMNATGAITAPSYSAKASDTIADAPVYFMNEAGTLAGRVFWYRAGAMMLLQNLQSGGGNVEIHSNGRVTCGQAINCRAGHAGAAPGYSFNLNWTTTTMDLWVDSTRLGAITYTSDYRIKKDVAELPGTWDIVKALRPIKYTQAAYTPQPPPPHAPIEPVGGIPPGMTVAAPVPEATPKPASLPMFVADNKERWGFIAHELQQTLIEDAATGVKDDPVNVQSPNPWTVIAALTKTLQEAMARIEALEAA